MIEKEFIFKNENIIKDKDGDIISKIIICNILNNTKQDNKIEKEKNIELSVKYKVLSEYTSHFAKIENENPNIDKEELKLIEQNYNDESENIEQEENNWISDSDEDIGKKNKKIIRKPKKKKIINEDAEIEDVVELEDEEQNQMSVIKRQEKGNQRKRNMYQKKVI